MKLQLSNTDYHKHPAIGASGLRLLNQAPAKYYSAYLDPDRKPLEPTAAMIKGTMVHTACLEPHKFDENYVIVPDGIDKRTNEGKQLWADIVASGKTAIKSEDATLAKTLAGVFHISAPPEWFMNPDVMIEQSFLLNMDGVEVKIRPDIAIKPCLDFPRGLVIDYKTSSDASPAGWGKSIANYEYWIQAALYAKAFSQQYGLAELPEFYWFAQETEAPFLNKIYRAPPFIMEYGWEECQRLLAIYRQCRDTDTWPGYGAEIEDADLPGWKMREIENEGGEIEVSYVND